MLPVETIHLEIWRQAGQKLGAGDHGPQVVLLGKSGDEFLPLVRNANKGLVPLQQRRQRRVGNANEKEEERKK